MIDLGSVACGGHFGDKNSIRQTLELLKRFDKKAGAHPSYPDPTNFGRVSMGIAPQDLVKSLEDQLGLFSELAKETDIAVDHIKFHGALYNDAAEKPELADLLLDFLEQKYPTISLFVPPHTELDRAAIQRNHPTRKEIFGDRSYLDSYRLASRSRENSLFVHSSQVSEHLDSIFRLGKIRTISGALIPIQADTICFHGDNPGILEILSYVRSRYLS